MSIEYNFAIKVRCDSCGEEIPASMKMKEFETPTGFRTGESDIGAGIILAYIPDGWTIYFNDEKVFCEKCGEIFSKRLNEIKKNMSKELEEARRKFDLELNSVTNYTIEKRKEEMSKEGERVLITFD